MMGLMLLLLVVSATSSGIAMEGRKWRAEEPPCVKESDTFKGPCVEDPPCLAACNNEGWPRGQCLLRSGPFTDLVCFCRRC
ncbi:hypothetical protein V2J09_009501 [Rumex salicifolius]